MKYTIDAKNWPEHQRKWWQLSNFIKILVGGYGCGKTWIGSLRAIYLSSINPGLSGICVSPSYQMAKKTIIPTIQNILTKMQVNFSFNISEHKFVIPTFGGGFWVASGDDPNSLKGPNLCWYWIDEPFIQSKLVFDQALFRVRVAEAKQAEIFLTGTPEELNWGAELILGPIPIMENGKPQYDIGYVYGKTKDNKFNDPTYYERLYNALSPEQREAYLEGKLLNLTQGRVYKEFDRDKHIKHVDKHESFQVYAGIDFNVDFMSCELFWYANNWVHFFDEIRMSNTNTFELAERLKQTYPGINVFPDPTGGARKTSSDRTDHQILRDSGFAVRCRDQVNVRDRVNAVNKMLREGRMSIEPGKCGWLVKDLERNVWEKGDIDKNSDPTLTHAADAAGYAIEYLFPVLRREAITIHR